MHTFYLAAFLSLSWTFGPFVWFINSYSSGLLNNKIQPNVYPYMDGLVLEKMDLRFSCINPSIYVYIYILWYSSPNWISMTESYDLNTRVISPNPLKHSGSLFVLLIRTLCVGGISNHTPGKAHDAFQSSTASSFCWEGIDYAIPHFIIYVVTYLIGLAWPKRRRWLI